MCDPGLVIGLIGGAAQAAGQMEAFNKNKKMINDQARLEHAAQAREFIVKSNAANKEAYNSALESERNKSYLKTLSGSMGTTVGERNAEQSRQGALSIANARDRSDAAKANMVFAGQSTTIEANNRIEANRPSGLGMFANVLSAGVSNYGAFT